MKTTTRRKLAGLLALIVPAGFVFTIALAGCGNKDEKPTGAGDYYTGPMQSKSDAGGNPLKGQGGQAAEGK